MFVHNWCAPLQNEWRFPYWENTRVPRLRPVGHFALGRAPLGMTGIGVNSQSLFLGKRHEPDRDVVRAQGFSFRCFRPYCGLAGSLAAGVELAAGVALAGVTGVLVAGAVWELGAADCDFGGSGTVVIALSGLSRWSLLGPRPRLINARESGTVLLCQP